MGLVSLKRLSFSTNLGIFLPGGIAPWITVTLTEIRLRTKAEYRFKTILQFMSKADFSYILLLSSASQTERKEGRKKKKERKKERKEGRKKEIDGP